MEVVWVALAVIGIGLLLWIAVAAFVFWRILRSDERKLAKRIALEDPERSERWAIDQEDLVCLEKRCSEAV